MRRPHSIGIVLHDFPLGGTERIALRLACAWGAVGVAVTIVGGEARGPLLAMVPASAHLIALDPPIARGRGSRRRLGVAAAAMLAVDALYVPGNYHWATIAGIAALPADRRPRIVAQISSPLAMPQRGWIPQRLFEQRMRRQLSGADAVVAMETAGAAQARRILGRDDVAVLPLPALDDDAPPPRGLPAARHVVAAGRLIRQKGFDVLIDAIARLPDTRLTIVGDGPERGRLERRISRAGLGDRVRLAGYAPDIRPFLDEARLFVLPSRFEGYGAVIVEALGAGRPVVATRTTPALADLPMVRGVAPEDPAALAAAIAAAFAVPADPAALAASVDRYRIGRVADAYLDLMAR